MKFSFNLINQDRNSNARAGEFITAHGAVKTPVFMPVGTLATVKSLNQQDLDRLGAQIILGNTYHLYLRPGVEVFNRFKGLHNFMNWQKPILTDSGGFQIFSLPRSVKMSEEGAVFKSYIDGTTKNMTPEMCMQIQNKIGSDIMMVLDECVASTSEYNRTKEAMELTHRWAIRSLNEYNFLEKQKTTQSYQSLFAIVQGGVFKDLRKMSAQFLTQHNFSGFAIGGLAVGETKSEREDMTEVVTELLPKNKPRYLMGVGTPTDLLEAIRRGVDMFDCIIPTKMAQQGNAYTSLGLVKLSQSKYKLSEEKLDPQCACSTCLNHTKSYLHHLTKCREVLGWHLISYHNLYFYQRLMENARVAILENRYSEFCMNQLSQWEQNQEEALLGHEDALMVHIKKKNRGLTVDQIEN